MPFDLKPYLKACQIIVDAALLEALPRKDLYPARLHEAMHYSLFAGGKRLRPVLVLAGAEACGGSHREVLPVACALEMIHTFSLIHDDLPAMDDDDLRRGAPTSHRVFGEATAILAGDALLAQAFAGLSRLKDSHPDPVRVLEIIGDIALATGSVGMVGGQEADLEAEGKRIDLDALKRLHRLKTGCLIVSSVLSGAKLITRDAAVLSALESYGRAVGLAFQITDDVLDIEGGEELGKDIGSDLSNGKSTYPALMGLAESKREAGCQVEEALESLRGFGKEADPLRAIAAYIIERRS